jgi:3-hydroxybutyryl-CoA dehydrogenase
MGVPERVGVLGGGRMGAGIAHAFLIAGSTVTIVDQTDEWASAGAARVIRSVEASVARQAVTEPAAQIVARLGSSSSVASFDGAELIVEAVPEDFEIKRQALVAVERVIPEGAWLATNTSSLSISRLAEALARPERLGGLHFFNPVPASALVEIVVADRTAGDYAVAARQWVEALGKTAITVRDSPGFASSRLGLAIALEAMRMVEDGVASAEDIDAAMVLGYRHPVGPLHTSDLVGLDVRLGIAEYLHAKLGDRFEPPRILRELVAEGNLGRKSGKGFFDYEGSGATP